MKTSPLAVYLLKLPAFSQQVRFVKALTGQFLCRKPFTSFGSAGTNYGAATAGTHSFTKTVGTLTF